MHEMALAENVLDVVVESALQANATAVKTIYLTIGVARDVVANLFDGLLGHLSRGTVAEGAEIVIVEAPVLCRCDECGAVYPVDYTDLSISWGCPSCGSKHYKTCSGMQFEIDRIEVI